MQCKNDDTDGTKNTCTHKQVKIQKKVEITMNKDSEVLQTYYRRLGLLKACAYESER